MKVIRRARVVIFHDSKLLLLKKELKTKYSFPGGVVKRNESLKEGLIREVYEEVGAQLTKNDLRHLYTFTKNKESNIEENNYYLLISPEKFQFKLLEPFKFSEMSWINVLEASNKMKFHEKFIIDEVLLSSYHKSHNDFLF